MSRVRLRPTLPADLEFVHATETDAENRPFIRHSTDAEHRAAMADPDWLHAVVERLPDHAGDTKLEPGCQETRIAPQPIGHLIARGLERDDGHVYLQRIAMAERDRGYGSAALQLLQRELFEERGVVRLWLRVYENNERARRVYKSLGFEEEDRVAASDPSAPVRIVMALSRGETG